MREVIEETNNLVSKNNEAIHSAEIQNLLNGQANGALDETFSEAELSVWANYNIKYVFETKPKSNGDFKNLCDRKK